MMHAHLPQVFRKLLCAAVVVLGSTLGFSGAAWACSNTNPGACTDKQLCFKSVTSKNYKKAWETDSFYRPYISEAKSRGLTCCVGQSTYRSCVETGSSASRTGAPRAPSTGWTATSCGAHNVKACSVQKICEGATVTRHDGVVEWRNPTYFGDWIAEAKARGLKCGVEKRANPTQTATAKTEPSPSPWLKNTLGRCSAHDVSGCSNQAICDNATNVDSNGKVTWKNADYFGDWIAEARARGLTCQDQGATQTVARSTTCLDDPAYCTEADLCARATIRTSTGTAWSTASARKPYADRARAQGLSCGVGTARPAVAQATCDTDPSLCSALALCARAVETKAGRKTWSRKASAKAHINAAKAVGLTCGVAADNKVVAKKAETKTPKVAQFRNRKALVIGNARYSNQTPLRNPINDAGAVAAKLKAVGFDVTLATDLGRRDMIRTLSRFGQTLQGSDIGLLYYAGHGIEIDGRNYLVPVDAVMEDAELAQADSIPIERAIDATLTTGVLSMVLIDACRDNPFLATMRGGTRSVGRGLQVIDPRNAAVNQIISFAAESGRVAEDGEGANSPYALALTELLDEPNLEVGKLFRRLGDRVLDLTDGKQRPVTRNRLSGQDIYLLQQ